MKISGKEEVDREVMKIIMMRNKEFIKELKHPVNDVEVEVNNRIERDIKQHWLRSNIPTKDDPIKPLRKLPLLDDMKLDNIEQKCLAEKKRQWKGRKGKFNPKELAKWFKVYDETQLIETRNNINKSKKRIDEMNYEEYLMM